MTGMDAPRAKRIAPPAVEPVTLDGLRFEAIHWGFERGLDQNGGYIAAIDTATGNERWILKVYEIDYDPKLESDVQDLFIERLAVSGDLVEVTDERGRRFTVDPRTRAIRP